jgi:uncharacterized protein (TIGR03066 family)
MKKSTVLSLVALSALVYSCKKDDDKSNAEKIVGKWNAIGFYENDHYNNADHKDTTIYPAGYETLEFTNSGTAIDKTSSWSDTATYKVDGSKLIMIYKGNNDSDTLTIKTLTDSDLQLGYRENYSNGDFYESITNLKK